MNNDEPRRDVIRVTLTREEKRLARTLYWLTNADADPGDCDDHYDNLCDHADGRHDDGC